MGEARCATAQANTQVQWCSRLRTGKDAVSKGAAGRTKQRGLSFPKQLEHGLYQTFKDGFQSDGVHICPTQTPMRAGVTRVTTAFFLNISGHCLQASSPSTTLYLSFDTKGAHPVRTET